MNIRKLFLYLSIVSIAVSALIGIAVILFGNFGDLETRVLLTTGTVTVVSILGLACGACLESRKARLVPIAGIVLALASGAAWLVMIWGPTIREGRFVEILMSITLLAASCAHISLISLADLDKRFLWSRWAAYATDAILTGMLLYVIWTHFDPTNTTFARVMGVLSIVVAALTILTPILHKLSSGTADGDAIDRQIAELKTRIEKLEMEKSKLSTPTG